MANGRRKSYNSGSNHAEPQNLETGGQASKASENFPITNRGLNIVKSLGKAATTMTFGVEVEFIAFYAVVRSSDEEAALRDRHKGVFLVPDHAEDEELYAIRQAILWLRHNGVDINDFDGETGDPELDSNADNNTPHSGNSRNPVYHRWSLQWDGSVYFDHNDVVEPGLKPLNFELISPAMKNEPASYQDIKRVVSLISQWKIYLPSTAGLHVHVGTGPGNMSLRALRSIAILLWAVDAIINPIHPCHRHNNSWCCRNRHGSNLARGKSFATVIQLPPGAKFIRIDQGIPELTKCASTADVANLMACPFDNGQAYSFDNYDPLKWNDVESSNDNITGRKPTVEFRQAAASINPDWLAHWSYMCVRMCEYAIRELPNDINFYLYQLVVRCQSIEDGKESYEAALEMFLKRIGCGEALNFIKSTTHAQRASG